MATFTVTIITPTKKKPAGGMADVRERAAIQEVLLQIVNSVSNIPGYYAGEVTGRAASAVVTYVAEQPDEPCATGRPAKV